MQNDSSTGGNALAEPRRHLPERRLTSPVCWALLLAATCSLHAGPRASANYSVPAESASAGAGQSVSASYASNGNVGDITGVSSLASPAETAKQGYVGQLYEVAAVQVATSPATVNEGAACQLSATATLDDATTLILSATEVDWSVESGPLKGISNTGLATAGNVYQDTLATAQGSYAGVTGTLGFTVNNVGTDDFGMYAGDGIPDSWQVQYFGVNNPLAAPAVDADGTGQDNLFKYTAGLNPTDPTSRFIVTIATIPVALQHTITFSPRLAGRTYTVQFSHDLRTWSTFTGWTTVDDGQTRTMMDIDNRSARKCYRVLISQP